MVVECISAKNHIPYEELTKGDFKYSFRNIKNVKDLKSEILKRYSVSLPNLSKDKLLSLGVSLTELKIIFSIKNIKLL